MTLEEQADQVILHEDQNKERGRFSGLCQTYLGMDDERLRQAGHKSLGDALVYATKQHKTKLNKLMTNFTKKWPD